MISLIQKIIVKVYKEGSKIINFILIFFVLNIILLSLYLYISSSNSSLIIINPALSLPSNKIYEVLLETIDNPPKDGNFFASKSGQYYYSKYCSAGKNIKNKNQIWFSSEEQAISSGYIKHPACQ